MYSQISWSPTQTIELEPLDRERFEQLTEAEAVSLLAGRSRCFVERGWSWIDALLLAVRPDGGATPFGGCVGIPAGGRCDP